ncbi:MAG: 4-(cytidine 5'-diphospho)-2-C-methyl-D-erythritol kinase [Clostridia bacterium]
MSELILKAQAKVNLSLEIINKRSDGYHNLRSLMHEIPLCDTLFISEDDKISIKCNIPLPENNTAFRAASLYGEACRRAIGANIIIEKHIPSEAGFGGGSADAAAVLKALQKIYGFLDEKELYSVAAKVGADVPFCLMGGAAIATGIGDILEPVPYFDMHIGFEKPDIGISTARLFSMYRKAEDNNSFYFDSLLKSYLDKNVFSVAMYLYNELEPFAMRICPKIEDKKRLLIEKGAINASMTGSGSAVFGIFK